ncbi:VanZ family protein [Alkalilimnicola ehrlichii]|uniref:VanZ family protein n=1 Tax=Alkalilimnicola ehrlichii TaxID=351052 RepID=UPI003BA3050B
MTHREPWQRGTCLTWAWLALGTAVYLTLLPFEFRDDLGLRQAWEVYRNMDLTGPGASGRQQFMANALMFLPLGFFWSAWLAYGRRDRGTTLATFLAVSALGLAVTATVEFLQIWLPFRHPAAADIAGNFTGAVLGSLAWFALRDPLAHWWQTLSGGGPRALHLALIGYLVVYVVIGLLPFDMVLSADELMRRLRSSAWGLWTTPDACTTGLRCYAWLSLEVAAAVPVGLLLAVWLQRRRFPTLLAGLPLAVVLAIGLEALNLLTLSGITEGRSVLLRSAGIAAGLVLLHRLPAHSHGVLRFLQQHGTLILGLTLPVYLLLLLGLNHGFGPYHTDLERAWRQWGELRLLPFYYHYHVPEIVALRSTALHLAMYAPVGLMAWLWHVGRPGGQARLYGLAAASGALAALLMEAGKLFVADARPDPASLVLGALAAWAVAAACAWLTATSSSRPVAPAAAPSPSGPSASPRHVLTGESPWHQALGALCGVLALVLALSWPVAAWALTAGLVAYLALLHWRPQIGLLIIPLLIPTLDLTLYTGRLFLSELDLFLLATLAVVLWRWPARPRSSLLPRAIRWPLILLMASTVISLVIALLSSTAIDLGQAYHYAHPLNAPRVAKGLLGALVLLGLMRVIPLPQQEQVERWLLPGVAAGLLATILIVIRERITYPGLLDLDSRYRISGFFTDMHVGGPSIETYLVLALPVALAWCLHRRLTWALAPLLAIGATYAIAVTYSRGGYLGLVVALVLFAGLALAHALRPGATGRGRLITAALVPLLATGAVALPFMDSFGERRLGQVQADFEQRLSHWREGLDLPGAGPWSPLIGRGLGSFPEAYRLGNREGRIPANFDFRRVDSNDLLRLGRGDSLFLNQRVAPPREGDFRLRVRARSDVPAGFTLFLCEKPVRHSFTCRSQGLSLGGGGDWEHLEWRFDLRDMDRRPWPFQRGLVLSITSRGEPGILLEFDAFELLDEAGNDHLRNGDFTRLGRHWYMSTDHLWPWRIENQWLELYFDQGTLGLLAFVWLTLAGLVLLGRRALAGDITALGLAAGLAGALAVGLFSTIFFSPRIATLFYGLLLLGVAATGRPDKRHAGPTPQAPVPAGQCSGPAPGPTPDARPGLPSAPPS